VNKPLGSGSLIRRLRGTPLPGFAGELGCASRAQLCLKFILANPAVTCVIPATGVAAHMAENVQARHGPHPDTAMRARLARVHDRF
jgi:aryl-alcohol dehydrogenase-like predicted oxidoreductase